MDKMKFYNFNKIFRVVGISILASIFLISSVLINSVFSSGEAIIEHQGDVKLSETSATIGDDIEISGIVMNIGNESVDKLTFNIELFWDYDKNGIPDKDESYYIEKNFSKYEKIEPNQTFEYEFNWKAGIIDEPEARELTGNFFLIIDIGYVAQDKNNTIIENNETGQSKSFTVKEKEKGLCMLSFIGVIPVGCIILVYKKKQSGRN